MSTHADMPAPERILVVDDERNIRDSVAFSLRREGFDVVLAETGLDALDQMDTRPDVVILDIMLPGLDGLEVCRRIRQDSSVPIILLSARGEEIDRVVGLEIGADDYLTKPFAMRELIARVRALIRRRRMDHVVRGDDDSVLAVQPEPGQGAFAVGDITIDPGRRQVTVRDQPVALKKKEFDLLEYFARHPGLVMTREALLREVWGYQHHVDTRTVDVHIRWLRQKLEDDPGDPSRILTVRGHGYRFVAVDA